MIGKLQACIGVTNDRGEWDPISGIIKTDGGPTDSLPPR